MRCRYCGRDITDTALCGWNEPLSNRSGTLGHVFVNEGTPGWKEHPYVQYAAELFELARMCERCGSLIREGAGPHGNRSWYSETTKREHHRECVPAPMPMEMGKTKYRRRTGGRR